MKKDKGFDQLWRSHLNIGTHAALGLAHFLANPSYLEGGANESGIALARPNMETVEALVADMMNGLSDFKAFHIFC